MRLGLGVHQECLSVGEGGQVPLRLGLIVTQVSLGLVVHQVSLGLGYVADRRGASGRVSPAAEARESRGWCVAASGFTRCVSALVKETRYCASMQPLMLAALDSSPGRREVGKGEEAPGDGADSDAGRLGLVTGQEGGWRGRGGSLKEGLGESGTGYGWRWSGFWRLSHYPAPHSPRRPCIRPSE